MSDRSPSVPSSFRRTVVSIVGGAFAVTFLTLYVFVPFPWTLGFRNPGRTALIAQRVAEARRAGETLEIRHEWVPLSQVSPNLVRAVLVAEDDRFREHRGIDWKALGEEVFWGGGDAISVWSADDRQDLRAAFAYGWAHRSEIKGRSTLTQQLAKNLYFGTERSLVRKLREAVVAGRLERHLGKDRILELYLNVVEWGPGVFGAEAAARTYFGRSSADLTLDQAAALAGTLPHPLTSNAAYRPRQMLNRKRVILRRLLGPGPRVPDPVPEPPPPSSVGDSAKIL